MLSEWSNNHLAYTVYQSEENKVLHSLSSDSYFDLFDFTEQEFQRLLEDESLFGFTFKEHEVCINTPYFTLVPKELFDPLAIEAVLRFNIDLPSTPLQYDAVPVKNTNYYLLYALPKELISAYRRKFPNVHFRCSLAKLIANLRAQNAGDNATICWYNEGELHIIDFKNKELQLCNAFTCNSPEDVVYFVLNAFRQLEYNHENRPLILMGGISQESEMYSLLRQYVKEITFLKRSPKLNYSEAVSAIPSHYFGHHYLNLI